MAFRPDGPPYQHASPNAYAPTPGGAYSPPGQALSPPATIGSPSSPSNYAIESPFAPQRHASPPTMQAAVASPYQAYGSPSSPSIASPNSPAPAEPSNPFAATAATGGVQATVQPRATESVVQPVVYRCGDCSMDVPIKPKDTLRCTDCGCRILFKKRTKSRVQFRAW